MPVLLLIEYDLEILRNGELIQYIDGPTWRFPTQSRRTAPPTTAAIDNKIFGKEKGFAIGY